jgi:hypothetical protein
MVARTWNNVRTFDDLVVEGVGEFTSKLERETENKCPYLKKKGKAFFYCGRGIHEDRSNTPSLSHPAYLNQQHSAELQLYCLGNYESCQKVRDCIA